MPYEFEAPRIVRRIDLPRVGDLSAFEEARQSELEAEWEEEIIGPDDTRTLLKDTTPIPHRFICRLFTQIKGGVAWGTGLLISTRHVLTVAHNIIFQDKQNPGIVHEALRVKVWPAYNGALANPLNWTPFGADTVLRSRCSVPRDWPKGFSRENDYALITLNEELGQKKFRSLSNRPLGFWGDVLNGGMTRVETTSPAALAGQPLLVSGYPTDKCRTIPLSTVSTCGEAERASTQWRAGGKALAPGPGPTKLLRYDADTKEGMSGGPVWRLDTSTGTRSLVGIHAGKGTGPFNEAVCITDEVYTTLQSWGWAPAAPFVTKGRK